MDTAQHSGMGTSRVTRQQRAEDALLPCICGVMFQPGRSDQRYCSTKCKDRAYNLAHPVSRQRAIDWTPAGRELGAALDRRETKAQRILARLQRGPADTMELARLGGVRFGARLLELRQAGHRILTEHHPDHAIYRLENPR